MEICLTTFEIKSKFCHEVTRDASISARNSHRMDDKGGDLIKGAAKRDRESAATLWRVKE